MANMWIRDDLLERLSSIDLGIIGRQNNQIRLEKLLNFYEKNKNKVPQNKGSKRK